MTNQTDTMNIIEGYESLDINIPIQKLFDDCIKFISVMDFME